MYTTESIYEQIGDGYWVNLYGGQIFEAISGTDSEIKSSMLTKILQGDGTSKWATSSTINNGYPYLVNNVPD